MTHFGADFARFRGAIFSITHYLIISHREKESKNNVRMCFFLFSASSWNTDIFPVLSVSVDGVGRIPGKFKNSFDNLIQRYNAATYGRRTMSLQAQQRQEEQGQCGISAVQQAVQQTAAVLQSCDSTAAGTVVNAWSLGCTDRGCDVLYFYVHKNYDIPGTHNMWVSTAAQQ